MERLRNTVREYAWGSRTALAEWMGAPAPAPQPQAEMWIGAHPGAPSRIATDPAQATLAGRISATPAVVLGEDVCRRFNGRLPFLLKVLAVESPLSLQAHPNIRQAREGYAREESRSVPLSAAERNYKDTNHKPEILCALGPFTALCGFRPGTETAELLESLRSPALAAITDLLRSRPGGEGVRAAFESLLNLAPAHRQAFLDETLQACRQALAAPGPREAELRWVLELAERYPGDIGAVTSLLLNLVHLQAGQAMYLPAGTLHAYLKGLGVELMASSDNVLRGGLTPKHVDGGELLRILDFRDSPFSCVDTLAVGAHETEYLTPAADFCLSRIEVTQAGRCRPQRRGPEILLCAAGSAEAVVDGAAPLALRRGESAFVPASDAAYSLTGNATVFRATVGRTDREPARPAHR